MSGLTPVIATLPELFASISQSAADNISAAGSPKYQLYITPQGQLGWTDPSVDLAVELGQVLGKTILGSIGFFTLILSFVSFVYIWFNRNWLPFKARQPAVVGGMIIGGINFFVGVCTVYKFIPCFWPWWCIFYYWLMVPFGLGLFLAMFFFRMWRLFLIFKKIKMTFWTLYGVTFLFYLPHLIDAIILTSMNMIRLFPVAGSIKTLVCINVKPFHVWINLTVFIWSFLGLAGLMFINRKLPPKHFNEYRRTLFQLSIFAVLFASYIAISSHRYHTMPGGYWGIVLPWASVMIFYWPIVGIPLYHHIFNREEYLVRFAAHFEFAFDSSSGGRGSTGASRSSRKQDRKNRANGKDRDLEKSISMHEITPSYATYSTTTEYELESMAENESEATSPNMSMSHLPGAVATGSISSAMPSPCLTAMSPVDSTYQMAGRASIGAQSIASLAGSDVQSLSAADQQPHAAPTTVPPAATTVVVSEPPMVVTTTPEVTAAAAAAAPSSPRSVASPSGAGDSDAAAPPSGAEPLDLSSDNDSDDSGQENVI
ncbi:hypothetical protein H696_00497 [Fonticula alba]|uniref:Uncharacterized protein n=1 Tax=Fonticula alba TaxID=691883 RepID=A0A058ZEY1_FONAL|nr:hypothetical protein H696_00497 [Fonticula alba]KCV72934.1 hypothetical protein H696_00497 [Fonticula alba]|eukprot:XP_009492635.1 hypothetical protein H696_00497 [Fonticula alba]